MMDHEVFRVTIGEMLSRRFNVAVVVEKLRTAIPGSIKYRVTEDSSGQSVFGMDLEFKWHKVVLVLHVDPFSSATGILGKWKSSWLNNHPLVATFAMLLESSDCAVLYYLNEKSASIADLACEEDWRKIGITVTSPYIEYELPDGGIDFYRVSQIIMNAWGMMLSLATAEEHIEELCDGEKTTSVATKYERNPLNRAACIAAKGDRCCVCGLSLSEEYGELGKGFIEVHHVVPVSTYGCAMPIDPQRDLVPVCPNCHAMLHRKNPPYTVEELAGIWHEGNTTRRY